MEDSFVTIPSTLTTLSPIEQSLVTTPKEGKGANGTRGSCVGHNKVICTREVLKYIAYIEKGENIATEVFSLI